MNHRPKLGLAEGSGIHSTPWQSGPVESNDLYTTYKSETLMMNSKTEDPETRSEGGRGGDILDPNNQIGIRLRSLYAAVQEETIPDRFLDLLEKLDHIERLSANKTGE